MPGSPTSQGSYATAPGTQGPEPLDEAVNTAFHTEWDKLFLDSMLNDVPKPTLNDNPTLELLLSQDLPDLGFADLPPFQEIEPVFNGFEFGDTDLAVGSALAPLTTGPSATMSLDIDPLFTLPSTTNEPRLDRSFGTIPVPMNVPIAAPNSAIQPALPGYSGNDFPRVANTQSQFPVQTQLRQAPFGLDDGNDADTESESVCIIMFTSG